MHIYLPKWFCDFHQLDCSITLPNPRHYDLPPPLRIYHKLHTIKLHAVSESLYDDVGEIFGHLTAPALKTLDLLVGNKPSRSSSWPMSSFSSFIARSSCAVTRLRLGESVMLPGDFDKCLYLLLSITELQLDNLPFADTHFSKDSWIPVWSGFNRVPGHQTALLPNLSPR